MIYQGYTVKASMAEWHYYEVNDDGTLGDWLSSGGQGGGEPEYDIYLTDEHGDEESVDGGYMTLDEAKAAIDRRIALENGEHDKLTEEDYIA